MKRRRTNNDDLDHLFLMLACAAAAGKPCPAGAAIADALGWSSPSSATKAIKTLERQGLIAVARPDRSSRIVTIVETGQSTAASGRGKPAARAVRKPATVRKAAPPARRRRQNPVWSGTARPGFSAESAATCQWIEGEPTADDACKCGAPTVSMPDGRRSSWCAQHRPICYRRAGDAAYGGHPAGIHPVGRRNP